MKIASIIGVLLLLATIAHSQSPEAAKPQPQLEAMKALAGSWTMLGEDGKPDPDSTVVYSVTSGGSTVLETLFGGTDHEMLTVYHLDAGALVLTHYCHLANQPKMRAGSGTDVKQITFAFDGGSNIDPAVDMHMHSFTLDLEGENRIHHAWKLFKGGQEIDQVAFTLVREGRESATASGGDDEAERELAEKTALLLAKKAELQEKLAQLKAKRAELEAAEAAEQFAEFGAGVSAGEAISVATVLANPDAYADKTVRVAGTVAEVCKKKGCWMRIGSEETNLFVRFKDYGFFVPTDTASGRKVILEGVLSVEEQSVEDQRHYLEDAGKPEEAALVTAPSKVVTLLATGVALEKN